ncbi:hypothetical protein HY745_04045 [Candidatus Desantisbacteria bacterium]|nr:hypothetical protein [Candidatus Desantisbacteria bacterium]
MSFYDYYRFPRYVSVGEKRAKAEKSLKQLKKKNPDMKPVIIEGQKLARTWWGEAWNKNLEKYADYSNRIGRGRCYLRHGAVLDLKITQGEVKSLVQGSSAKPYSITIKIKPINKNIWEKIKKECEGKIESLQELLEGGFPKALREIFTTKGCGLFPSPDEINFECSCPDWASMCKHVAATLYGIGVRLDEDPKLFFTLRKAEMDDLITQALQSKSKKMLKKAKKKTARVIDKKDLSGIFNIDMDEKVEIRKKHKKTVIKKD